MPERCDVMMTCFCICTMRCVLCLDPMFGLDMSDDLLLEDMNSLDSTDIDLNGAAAAINNNNNNTPSGRSSTPSRGRPPANPDVTAYRRRLAASNKQVQHLQQQVRQEQEQAVLWRTK